MMGVRLQPSHHGIIRMSIDALKEQLRSWIQANSWYTDHESDEERFYIALKGIFDQLGHEISGNDFEEAMAQLASELHPNINEEYRSEFVNKYASKAETISTYLSTIQNS